MQPACKLYASCRSQQVGNPRVKQKRWLLTISCLIHGELNMIKLQAALVLIDEVSCRSSSSCTTGDPRLESQPKENDLQLLEQATKLQPLRGPDPGFPDPQPPLGMTKGVDTLQSKGFRGFRILRCLAWSSRG